MAASCFACEIGVTDRKIIYEECIGFKDGRMIELSVPIGSEVFMPCICEDEDGEVIGEVEALILSGYTKEGGGSFILLMTNSMVYMMSCPKTCMLTAKKRKRVLR